MSIAPVRVPLPGSIPRMNSRSRKDPQMGNAPYESAQTHDPLAEAIVAALGARREGMPALDETGGGIGLPRRMQRSRDPGSASSLSELAEARDQMLPASAGRDGPTAKSERSLQTVWAEWAAAPARLASDASRAGTPIAGEASGATAGAATGDAASAGSAGAMTGAAAGGALALPGLLMLMGGLGLVIGAERRGRSPTVSLSIDDPVLAAGETGTLRFAFSAQVQGFSIDDIDPVGATVSDLRATADPQVWLATIRPLAGTQALEGGADEISISVRPESFRDAQGRAGLGTTAGFDADTVAPRVAVFGTPSAIAAGGRSRVDLVFSEPVAGLALEDLIAAEGRLENLSDSARDSAGQPRAWSVDFIADASGFDPGAARVTVRAGSYNDLAGNAGLGGSGVVDARVPQLQSITADAATDSLTLAYDVALQSAAAPLTQQFTLTQGGVVLAVQTITVAGNNVQLSVPNLTGGAFTLAYDPGPGADSSLAIQSAAGVDAQGFLRGLVADGYVHGARIYLDDGDGLFEPGIDLDTGVLTARDGSFVLAESWLEQMTGGRGLIALGGVSIDTGVPNTITLAAPAGASVINPLTTLAQALVASGEVSTVAQAQTLISTALGLTIPAAGLGQFDPIAGAQAGAGSPAAQAALAAQKAATQVATLLTSAQTQQASSSAGESAERALTRALAEAIADRAQAIVEAGATPSTPVAPLDLADAATVQQLATQAATITASRADLDDVQITWSSDTLEALSEIDDATDIEGISLAQQDLLDTFTPAAPVLKTLVPSMNGLPERFLIELPESSGAAPADLRAGDRIEIRDASGALVASYQLTDVDLGNRLLRVFPEQRVDSLTGLSLSVVDRAGNASARANPTATTLPDQPGDMLDLGVMLTPFVQSALQAVANFEIPLVGTVGSVIDMASKAQWLEDILDRLPVLRLRSGSATDGPVLKSTDDSGFYFGDESNSGFVIDDTPQPPSGSDSSTSDWTTDNSGFIDLEPSGEGDSNGSVDWDKPDEGANASAYRFTGRQTGAPSRVQEFSFSAETGEFELYIVEPDSDDDGYWFNEGMGGMIGGNGAMALIDANLAGYGVFEMKIAGKVTAKADAYEIVTIDTEKTFTKYHVNVGLSEGSTVAGMVGPITLVGRDQASSHVTDTATRLNTGFEGGVTLSYQDFDGKSDKRLSLLKGAEALLSKLGSPTPWSALTDTMALRAHLEGRLSAHVTGGLDLGRMIDDPTWSGLASLLALSLDADLTLPVKLVYDSTNNSKNLADWGKLHLDNIEVGIAPAITEATGAALDFIDPIMKPLYLIENFFSAPLPWPAALERPMSIEGALPNWVPDFIIDLIDGIVAGPSEVINEVINGIRTGLDRNGDGIVTVMEAIRQSASYYYEMVKLASEAWDAMNVAAPTLKATLAASGYGAVLLSILETLETQKQVFKIFFDYIDYLEEALATIDQLEQLSQMHSTTLALIEQQAPGALGRLALPLGSITWDIPAGDFTSTDGNRYNLIDRVLAPRSDPEPDLSSADAIKRLLAAGESKTLGEAGAGKGGIHEYVYYHAGIDGVTADNLAAINSLLISSGINNWVVTRNPRFDTVRPGAAGDDPDWGVRLVGKLREVVEAYAQVQRVVWRKASAEDLESLLKAFQTLEVKYDLEKDPYRIESILDDMSGKRMTSLLTGIIYGQRPGDLDTAAELQNLINLGSKWYARAFASNFELASSNTEFTRAELLSLGLDLYSTETGADDPIKQVNQTIRTPYSDSDAQDFSKVREKVTALNAAWEKAQRDAGSTTDSGQPVTPAEKLRNGIKKIADAAKNNDAANTLTVEDFVNIGVTGIEAGHLAGFASFLDSTPLDDTHVANVGAVQKRVNAYLRLLETAGSKLDSSATKAEQFYEAIDALILKDRAKELEHIPFANSSRQRPDSRALALPLLQEIVSTQSDDRVDTYGELDAIVTATREVLMASMADVSLWSELLAKKDPWKSNKTDWEQARTKHRGYTTTLTADQLKLIGFPDATDETITAVKKALGTYRFSNYDALTGATGFYFKGPKNPLKLTDLGSTAEAPTDQIAELLKDLPLVRDLWLKMKDLGFEFPLLQSTSLDTLDRFLNNESIELVRWTPELPSIESEKFSLEYNPLALLPFYAQANLIFPFSLPVGLEGEFSLIPRLSMGVDTYALQSIREAEGRSFKELLLNSIYFYDRHESDGVFDDLPELEIDFSLLAFAELMLGKKDGLANLYAKVFGGPDLHLEFDLVGDSDGKLRIYDMLSTISDINVEGGDVLGQLGGNILKLIDLSGNLDLTLGAEVGVNIDLTPQDRSDMSTIAKALSDAYAVAAEWLNLETAFNWNLGYDFEVPVFSFDTGAGTGFLNV